MPPVVEILTAAPLIARFPLVVTCTVTCETVVTVSGDSETVIYNGCNGSDAGFCWLFTSKV